MLARVEGQPVLQCQTKRGSRFLRPGPTQSKPSRTTFACCREGVVVGEGVSYKQEGYEEEKEEKDEEQMK
ncbi:hypothetical protein Pmani_028473 [Petrolisthes manimaculis]|uniref:Uncharacterized protein n=1 Tax=Petrolisthes manimaculis TaxID=1843537 RepID=A0AAE1P153_9EUCA|nr:hypothetical protein Pmani_028473 [Petrolisthes manimaculis]